MDMDTEYYYVESRGSYREMMGRLDGVCPSEYLVTEHIIYQTAHGHVLICTHCGKIKRRLYSEED